MSNPVQTVHVDNYRNRVYSRYPAGAEPYSHQDTLDQKLWSVVNTELGPSAADVTTKKLVQAVLDHIAKGGVRR